MVPLYYLFILNSISSFPKGVSIINKPLSDLPLDLIYIPVYPPLNVWILGPIKSIPPLASALNPSL